MAVQNTAHQSLMDNIYAKQRHIYDASRKYYLLGRDRLIDGLMPPHAGRVLEIGCGTGRNLVKAAKHYPNAQYFGFDISNEMLKSAKKLVEKNDLQNQITLSIADATHFTAKDLLDQTPMTAAESVSNIKNTDGFERIFISYSLSMIPCWEATIDNALAQLSPQGSLHIIDFGQQTELPSSFRWLLMNWLKLFHVTPRVNLERKISEAAQAENRSFSFQKLYRDYSQYAIIGPKKSDI